MKTTDSRAALRQEDLSVVPVVARPSAGVPTALIAGSAVLAAVLLFAVLESRRHAASVPPITVTRDGAAASEAAPPLDIPNTAYDDVTERPLTYRPSLVGPVDRGGTAAQRTSIILAPPVRLQRADRTASLTATGPPPLSVPPYPSQYAPPPPRPADLAPPPPAQPASAAKLSGYATTRTNARSFEHPSDTVMQGTLIAAVLETGFDSTLPGFARAIVSRHVMSFDGTRLLIPRGSHLIGEYQSDTGATQKRARIVWTRLVRPDGINIDLDSPTTDPVGRGGIKAKVNSHFMKRFVGSLLQTVVNVGSTFTGRSSSTAVVIAGPNAASSVSQLVPTNDLQPTLRVEPGTSVSVFVARDLDFTEVENR